MNLSTMSNQGKDSSNSQLGIHRVQYLYTVAARTPRIFTARTSREYALFMMT